MRNVSDAFIRPLVGGVFSPFRYCQSTKAESGLPDGIRATQSVALPGPFEIVIETWLPPVTVVGVTVIVAVAALPCTVITALVATTVYPPFANSFTT